MVKVTTYPGFNLFKWANKKKKLPSAPLSSFRPNDPGVNPAIAQKLRLDQAQQVQKNALAGGRVGYGNTAALSNANQVARRLFPGSTSNRIGFGGGGGGGGGYGGGGSSLANDYQKQLDAAKAANESRYNEGKGLLSDLLASGKSRLADRSNQAQLDIASSAEKAGAEGMADLVDRGFRASTIASNINRDVGRQTREGQLREKDLRIRSDLATEQSLTGNLTQFIENKTDAYPNEALFAQLSQSQGRTGGIGAGMGGIPLMSGNSLYGFGGPSGQVGGQGAVGPQGGFNQLPAPFQQAVLQQRPRQQPQQKAGGGIDWALVMAQAELDRMGRPAMDEGQFLALVKKIRKNGGVVAGF